MALSTEPFRIQLRFVVRKKCRTEWHSVGGGQSRWKRWVLRGIQWVREENLEQNEKRSLGLELGMKELQKTAITWRNSSRNDWENTAFSKESLPWAAPSKRISKNNSGGNKLGLELGGESLKHHQ